MPHKHCSHGLCQSDSRKEPERKFANFPKPRFGIERVREWVQLCGRSKDNFDVKDVTKYMYVCDLHFEEDTQDLDYRTNKELKPFPVGHVRRNRRRRRSPSPPGRIFLILTSDSSSIKYTISLGWTYILRPFSKIFGQQKLSSQRKGIGKC